MRLREFIDSEMKKLISKPWLPFAFVLIISISFASYIVDFELDASSDSLLLENDEDLRYYRGIKARYGDDEFLVVTYKPKEDLFATESIEDLRQLRDELSKVRNVESVVSILDVPLLKSPPKSLSEIADSAPTFFSEGTDRVMAKNELLTSTLYKNLIISEDGQTTAILVNLKINQVLESMIEKRDNLRLKRLSEPLNEAELDELETVSQEIKIFRKQERGETAVLIQSIRNILNQHKEKAEIFLGGAPMITVDMIDFIQKDIQIFGAAILLFLIVALLVIFKNPRWMLISMACCLLGLINMTGFLGLVGWPITVVSANFVALLLIFSLSISVHLTVRYRELASLNPDKDQTWLVHRTMKDKLEPCFYTTITTMVGFGSLLVAGIKPVIDFGWMMLISMGAIFTLVFLFFPAVLTSLKKIEAKRKSDWSSGITNGFAEIVVNRSNQILIFFLLLASVSVFGITKLTAENQFIKAFKEDTEIFQGLTVIDNQLGGTTPLDIIIEADPDFQQLEVADDIEDEFFENEFFDDEDTEYDIGGDSYWYNSYRLKTIDSIHEYLESLEEAGKVVSFSTTMEVLKTLNDDEEIDTFFLSLLYKKVPEDVKEALFDPYLSDDGNQLRISFRVFESYPELKRNQLIEQIKSDLVEEIGLKPSQIKLTGLLVLYNNVLESLIRSQILTIGVVFLAITLMFLVLFRSIRYALVAIVPSIIASSGVLGLMGLLNIPLDVMTITIAAICIGIGVDHSIHYIHRFREEIGNNDSRALAIRNAHSSTGQAIYFTSIIIIVGFSILGLSNFIPTIYFGIFTAFAMAIALIANLTLLPVLLMKMNRVN